MWWIVAIIILILLVVSAGFRKIALVIVAAAAIGGFILYQNNQREEQLSRQRISKDQLKFEKVVLKNSNYGDFSLSGRIINNSKQHTLTDVGLQLTFRDCVKRSGNSDCIIIGETTDHISINIPPGQARDFDENIYMYGDKMNPKGNLVWDYKISYIKAK